MPMYAIPGFIFFDSNKKKKNKFDRHRKKLSKIYKQQRKRINDIDLKMEQFRLIHL